MKKIKDMIGLIIKPRKRKGLSISPSPPPDWSSSVTNSMPYLFNLPSESHSSSSSKSPSVSSSWPSGFILQPSIAPPSHICKKCYSNEKAKDFLEKVDVLYQNGRNYTRVVDSEE